MRLIGLMGRTGAGRKTCVAAIQSCCTAGVFAFSALLKREVAAAFHVDERLLHDQMFVDASLRQFSLSRCDEPDFVRFAGAELARFGALKPRTVMQCWGDWRRQRDLEHFLGPAWPAYWAHWHAGCDVLLVPDIRYPAEAHWVRNAGGELWRIERPGLPPVSSMRSEALTRAIPADATLRNDGTLEDVHRVCVDTIGSALARHGEVAQGGM